jgi:antagonist of KipI
VTAHCTVIKAGLLTSVQDLGRWGAQSRGVSVAGPMDLASHRIANALAGNDPRLALLEVTLIGPEIQFDDDRVVAVAGAEFDMSLDGRTVPHHAAFRVGPGSRLRFGRRVRGTRSYVAIGGGIAVPMVLGSRSTHLVSRVGGFEGRALAAGDRVPLGEAARTAGKADRADGNRIVRAPAAIPDHHARVRVLAGPQRERFVDEALDVLQSAPYTIATDSDRMGFRLQGAAIDRRSSVDIISDATPLGVLQVPASGQPLLLMADRQTTGGYPKIATVISADIPLAGQLGPGDTIAFEVCSRRDALAALIAHERALMAIESAVAP